MEWFRLSTKLPRDPKWKRLSPRAKVAYIEWACEIAEQETDGLYYATGSTPRYVDELLEAGLVVAVAEGYELPAYLKWNRTHAEMEADRQARSESGRKAANARWHAKRMPDASDVRMQEGEGEVEREIEEPKTIAPRKRDALFDAVVQVCGINPADLTKMGRGPINRALAELRGVGATPAEVRRRAGHWPFEVALTAPGLAKHWASLGAPPNIQQRHRGANDHLAALADRLEKG